MKNTLNLCFAILFLAVLGCSCPSKLAELANKSDSSPPRTTPGDTAPGPSTRTSTDGDYDLTMAKYNQLTDGMARSRAEEILGGKGTEISSSNAGGMRFSVNKWEGDGFKTIILSFKNDKILSKSQAGLK